MEEKTNSIWKDALKPGLILSLILIIFSVIVYVFDLVTIGLFAGLLIALLSILINFFALLFLMKAYRNNKFNGLISFGKIFAFGIVLGLYSSVILSVYNFTFNNVIDPDYEKNTTIKMQEKMEQSMIKMGVPDDAIEEQMKKMEENLDQPPAKKIISGFFGNFIFVVIASLIAAAIIKKNPDPYQEAMQDIEE